MADTDLTPPSIGSTLGAYEISGLIAAGGMGAVYVATHRITGERRALKVMRAELTKNRDFVTRFMREVRIAATLVHPNLVRVFEPGMEGDTVFLPMELLEGSTLSDRIRMGGALPEGEAVAVIRAVGQAVLAVHKAGVIHRDLKPSNIYLARGADGVLIPKVLDLGAAKAIQASEEETATGVTIGSPHYMSFEQASGAKDVDERTDQYSLAVVLYHALTGGRPYENDDSGNALAKVLAGMPFKRPRELVPDLSTATEEAVLRALSRDRNHRFSTLQAFLDALPDGEPDMTRVALLEPPPKKDVPPPAPTFATKGVSGPTALVSVHEPAVSNVGAAVGGVLAALAVGAIAFAAFHQWSFRNNHATDVGVAAPARVSAPPPPPVATYVEPLPLPPPAPTLYVVPEAPSSVAAAPGVASAAPHERAPQPESAKPAAAPPPKTTPKSATRPCVPSPGLPCF